MNRPWGLLFGGLLVWSADFILLYGIASIFLTTPTARLLAIFVTVAALASDLWLLAVSWKRYGSPADKFDRWIASIALLGAALSAVAVVWQGLPAILM